MKRLTAALAGFCLVLSACSSDPTRGYAFSGSRAGGVHTVSVPMFGNKTFMHGIETDLTDAVIKEIQRHTGWSVTNAGGAETTLTGTITSADLKYLSLSGTTGLVQEQAVELTIDFEWRDASGKTLSARRNFKALESFVPQRGVGERVELAEHAAVQELARAIVGELRSAW